MKGSFPSRSFGPTFSTTFTSPSPIRLTVVFSFVSIAHSPMAADKESGRSLLIFFGGEEGEVT
ncbi:WSSV525 [White spot syndrome virus]|uniref:WSSV525 n=1 Tax=White spot syndrome virus TaxID=92652 RepID=Q8QTA2_WSSV|nr:WSSV525 [Shrimp white spot syndrome virus]